MHDNDWKQAETQLRLKRVYEPNATAQKIKFCIYTVFPSLDFVFDMSFIKKGKKKSLVVALINLFQSRVVNNCAWSNTIFDLIYHTFTYNELELQLP